MESRISFRNFENIKLNKGELGLILGKRGSGKTACLINIGIDAMLQGKRILHVSIEDVPDRIESYYALKIKEFVEKIQNLHDMESQKTILSYLNQSFSVKKLYSVIRDLGSFFDIMLVDGIEAEDTDTFDSIKSISKEYGLETWLTYPSDRYYSSQDRLYNMFEVILELYADHKSTYLLLLKGSEKGIKLELDPVTFFVKTGQ